MSSVQNGSKSTLATAIKAVAEACRVTREVQAELVNIQKMTKDDRSPVTVADFAAQAIVCHELANGLGSDYQDVSGKIRLVGEETADDLRDGRPELLKAVTKAVQSVHGDLNESSVLSAIDLGNHDASSDSYWTLDPVDGTKGFLRGGQYAVSLALIESGEVTLGVMGCPNLSASFERQFDDPDQIGCIYFSERGTGAWYLPSNDINASPEKITANETIDLDALRVCESVESSHSKQDDTVRILSKLGATSSPARLDSQCKYAVVGRGQADAYLRLPTHAGYVEKIWDHAAGKLVAEEAGAIVSDITGAPLDFAQGATLKNNRGVVCTSPSIHGAIIEAIKSLGIA